MWLLRWLRRRRHERCLARIAALEAELYPPAIDFERMSMERFRYSSPQMSQILRAYYMPNVVGSAGVVSGLSSNIPATLDG